MSTLCQHIIGSLEKKCNLLYMIYKHALNFKKVKYATPIFYVWKEKYIHTYIIYALVNINYQIQKYIPYLY